MREKMVCRFCQSNTENLGIRNQNGRRPFAIAGAVPHYAPDRPFHLEHILLEVQVDPFQKSLAGKVTHRVRTIAPNQKGVQLDQIGLEIQAVTVRNEAVKFEQLGNQLFIQLSSCPAPDEVFEFTIQYQTRNPRRGIYFTGPDSDYPSKPYQAWTQGQDEDSRYWFPTLDYPNQKATTEMIATVPQGFTAVSNGRLVSKQDLSQRGQTQFHYHLSIPQVTYLITLVVAELSEWSEVGPGGLPIQYFVAPGREADGRRAFGNTTKMIEAFEKVTGVPYPYEKYSQVAVQDFIFGGMENTSATTQTDLTLHDERAHLDFSSDPLVAHELAHQWFGDLLTCRDWSHGWLNEGFATFMERVWIENKQGPGGGSEEAKYYTYQDLKEYLDSDQHQYRRPIVCNTYIEPIDLFDTHLYQKGGLVLNLIRSVLGEGQFWKSVQLYLNRHRGQNVETLDLIRAIEDATGRNLRRLFDEWVFQAGYPELEVSYQWHEDRKLAEWVIEQKQTEGKLSLNKEGVMTPLFHLPVNLEMTLADGREIRNTIEMGEVRERVFLAAPEKPVRVRLDPGFTIPKTMKFSRPKEMLIDQLKNDADCMGRIEAAQELGKIPDSAVVKALGEAGAQDAFWGVQAEIAQVLSGIRMDSAKKALLETFEKVTHPKARRAWVKALGTFKDSDTAEVLRRSAEREPSYFVEAEATTAWVSAQLNPSRTQAESEIQELEAFLLSQLRKESYRDVIRAAALGGLAQFPGISRGEHPRALQALMEWTRRGHSNDVRVAAVRALGKVLIHAALPVKKEILELFSQLSDEDSFRLRVQLVASLEESGWTDAIPLLSKIRTMDLDGRVRRGCQTAIDSLMTSGGVPESIHQLKSALEKLEEDQRKLQTKLEERAFH